MLINKQKMGMSIVELILAFGLIAISIFPMISLLYSLSPKNLEQSLGLDPDSEPVSQKFLSKNILLNNYEKSKNFRGNIVNFLFGGYDSLKSYFSDTCSFEYPDMQNFSSNLEQLAGDKSLSLNPVNISEIFENLKMSSSAIPTGISTMGQSLVMTVNSSSTTDPDILILKRPILSDGVKSGSSSFESASSFEPTSAFKLISALDTGPGLDDLYIEGFTAFVANTSINSQAQAIDLSDEIHPKIIAQYKFPGSTSSTTPIAKKIIVYKNLLIVGTQKSTLPEVVIFDMANGQVVANVDTEYGINFLKIENQISDIYKGEGSDTDVLYVLGPSNPEIEIFDLSLLISELTRGTNMRPYGTYGMNLSKIGEYDADGGSGNGKILEKVGNIFIFGRTKGDEEVSVLSPATSTPDIYGHETLKLNKIFGQKITASVDAIVGGLRNTIAFTSDPDKSLIVFDTKLASEDKSPQSLSLVKNLSLPGRVTDIDCADNTLYISLKNNSYPLFIMKPI